MAPWDLQIAGSMLAKKTQTQEQSSVRGLKALFQLNKIPVQP